MLISDWLLSALEAEVPLTRVMLEAVPADRFDWQPHPKSMSLGALAGHLAEMPLWIASLMEDEMDFAQLEGYRPFVPATKAELLTTFEDNAKLLRPGLAGRDDAFMSATWTMRHGDKIVLQKPRGDVLREIQIHHLAHHRGQLTVYLRLLDVPVPSTYGPTADAPSF